MSTFANSDDPDEMQHDIMLHFIRVYTVKGKKDLQTKEFNIFFFKYNLTPWICKMDYPKFIVSNQKEESSSIQRVKKFINAYTVISENFARVLFFAKLRGCGVT